MTAAATSIAANLAAVRARIAEACERAGRDPAEVTIVGVTKTHPPSLVEEALAAGLTDIGENRAQELLPKAEALEARGLAPRWHFIGRLQRNKVRGVLPHIAALHSLDSARLAGEIERRADRLEGDGAAARDPLPCYLEVNVAGEASKDGIAPEQLPELLHEASKRRHIAVAGVMTVAPLVDDPEQVRPVFRQLRELAHAHGLEGLSMGMTDDYAVAVEEGSTVVRLGRVIFGARRS
ncbi:MAG: YggS family pyridoxal phosphate-dependent enzyme [Chloroflexi bacterium]|nr:YggS family pyridoxal phosphate-dependent enzyme [Chloroflexota bacterium]